LHILSCSPVGRFGMSEKHFRKLSTMPTIIVSNMKIEMALWSMIGSKHLGSIMSR
jgi:hypothetical protein